MTPELKAKEIYDAMKGFRVKNSHRKMCALKCVDEIIDAVMFGYDYEWIQFRGGEDKFVEYWNQVKSNLEKL